MYVLCMYWCMYTIHIYIICTILYYLCNNNNKNNNNNSNSNINTDLIELFMYIYLLLAMALTIVSLVFSSKFMNNIFLSITCLIFSFSSSFFSYTGGVQSASTATALENTEPLLTPVDVLR